MSNDPLSQEIGSGDRPRRQEAMGGVIAQTRSERASKHSYDSPLPGGHTPGSDEGRLQQEKLTDIVTALVKSLEDELKFQKSKSKRRRLTIVTSKDEEDLVVEDPSKQGRSLIEEMDLDGGISLVSLHVEVQGSTASSQRNADTTADDLTLAETLMEIKKNAEWDDVLARVVADEDFVQQLQADEKCSEEDLPMKLVELVKEIFETTMRKVQSFVPMGSELEVQRLKRAGQEVLEEPVKYPIIDWEVYSEDTRRYWKIIRVGNHTKAFQIFAEMLKKFDRDDLVKLWDLVKERFSTIEPIDDKEKELWVELKRLFKPNNDTLWKLQRYMHDPLVWRLYDTCGVHHVSSVRGHEIFMLVEKEYPLTRGLMTVMLANKLQVDQYSEMANELLRKIFILANKPRH
ncbi:hypothetical protein Tco_0865285 [Tanacetum coccineum]